MVGQSCGSAGISSSECISKLRRDYLPERPFVCSGGSLCGAAAPPCPDCGVTLLPSKCQGLIGSADARSALSRNDAVENGERMRPACCRRRRAVGFVLTNLPTVWWRTAVGEKFAARRRQPHTRGVCSPFSTTSSRLRPFTNRRAEPISAKLLQPRDALFEGRMGGEQPHHAAGFPGNF